MTNRLIRLVGIVILVVVGAALWSHTPVANADQALPPYAWYSVVWEKPADTLHWVGPLGEVASISRPQLPNELPGGIVQIAISPDGRYLVVAAELSNPAVEGLGIYDLGAGQFIQVHHAQPGETIHLGPQTSFSRFTGKIAVGFKSGDFNNPAWRVIAFDLASGNVLDVLDSTHPNVPNNQLMIPVVREYGVNEGQGAEDVHFQLIPYGTGGALEYPAIAWIPNPAPANQANAVQASPYTHAESDIHFLSGEEVYTATDPNYTSLPPMGPDPGHNAVARSRPADPTFIWADGTSWHWQARWAAGNQWVLYRSDNGQGAFWNVILANGTPGSNQRQILGPAVTNVAGTPDGYLMVAGNLLYYTNSFDNTSGTMLFQGAAGQELRVVYVTPAGVQFALASLGENGGVVNTPGDVAPPQGCQGAPAPRLTVGQSARVAFTDGAPLNLRNAPNGGQLVQLAEGTVVSVVGGPQCQDGYNWWQIQVVQGAAVSGWAAEGSAQVYFLEPWVIGVTPGNVAPVPTAVPTVELNLGFAPVATATPGLLIAAPVTAVPPQNDCTLAPQQHVGVGVNIITTPNDGTYALFTNLSDEFPSYQIQPGTTGFVVDGWGCKNKYRMWKVDFNVNNQTVTGWISEGTSNKYFIELH